MKASEYIEFDNVFEKSNIDFEYIDQLENSFKEDCILFLSIKLFFKEIPNLEQWLSSFFKCNSFLVLNDGEDSITRLYKSLTPEIINLIKQYKDSILIYYSGTFEEEVANQLKDLNFVKRQESEYLPMIKVSYNQKIKDLNLKRSNNFLLTTVLYESKKYNRPHRTFLVNELEKLNMLKYHIGKIHRDADYKDTEYFDGRPLYKTNWAGDDFAPHEWRDSIISWSFYNTSSFEIVPETLHTYASWITEKTLKPIIAKIPFLILSNKDFYTYFKSIGFKTFDSLIDESFAYIDDVKLRSEGAAVAAKYIINNDALKFYEASKEICEYNFNHWLYMKSKDDHDSYINMLNYQSYIDNFNN